MNRWGNVKQKPLHESINKSVMRCDKYLPRGIPIQSIIQMILCAYCFWYDDRILMKTEVCLYFIDVYKWQEEFSDI